MRWSSKLQSLKQMGKHLRILLQNYIRGVTGQARLFLLATLRWRYDEVTHHSVLTVMFLYLRITECFFQNLKWIFKLISPLNFQENVKDICRCYLQHFLQHKTLLFCTMNSDGATSNFIAIQHKVIVLATNLQTATSKYLSKAGAQLHLTTRTQTAKTLGTTTWHSTTLLSQRYLAVQVLLLTEVWTAAGRCGNSTKPCVKLIQTWSNTGWVRM